MAAPQLRGARRRGAAGAGSRMHSHQNSRGVWVQVGGVMLPVVLGGGAHLAAHPWGPGSGSSAGQLLVKHQQRFKGPDQMCRAPSPRREYLFTCFPPRPALPPHIDLQVFFHLPVFFKVSNSPPNNLPFSLGESSSVCLSRPV